MATATVSLALTWATFEYLSFVDTTPPQVTLTVAPPAYGAAPTVTVTAVDAGAGVPDGTTVYLDVDLNGDGSFTGDGEAGYTTATLTGGAVTFAVSPNLVAGAYSVRARVSDLANNEGVSNLATIQGVGDAYEPDDPIVANIIATDGTPETHSIMPAGDVDWVKFILQDTSNVVIQTNGSSGDTQMWLYGPDTYSLDNPIAYNDDNGTDHFSTIVRSGEYALPPGTYLVKIDAPGNETIADYTIAVTATAIPQNHWVVTTAANIVNLNDGVTSLREAISYANDHPGDDTITFDPSLAGKTITLTNGDLDIYMNLEAAGATTIIGLGADQLTIDGNDASSVFNVGSVATLSGLTITHGHTADSGGGIVNYGNLTLADCVISGNSSDQDGGGIEKFRALTVAGCTISGNSAVGDGGGINNRGTLTVTACTISGNSANNGGGISVESGLVIYIGGGAKLLGNPGILTVVGCTLSGNSATAGGGIYNNAGITTVIGSTIAQNSASDSSETPGGGIEDHIDYYGSFLLENSIVADNTGNGSPSDISGRSPPSRA